MNGLRQAARDAHLNGLCVIPAAANGTKQPWPDSPKWTHFQTQPPTPEQIDRWFANGRYDGMGIVCGRISGGLEMFELEGRAVEEGLMEALADIADASGLGELWARVTSGYMETTPSGGYHLLYRVVGDSVARNTELARRPRTPDELAAWKAAEQVKVDAEPDDAKRARRQKALDRITRGEQKPLVLIETRGEGGFVIVSPSSGRTHPTGRAWALKTGGYTSIPILSPEERDALHHLAGALDQMPAIEPEPTPRPRPVNGHTPDGVRPGDDFNLRATWDDILLAEGWTKVYVRGGVTYWRRPGKNIGVSATTGRNDSDNLYVFSSSTVFDTETPYSKFAAYTLLAEGSLSQSAFSAAGKTLRGQGYGSQSTPDRLHVNATEWASAPPADAEQPDQPDPADIDPHTPPVESCSECGECGECGCWPKDVPRDDLDQQVQALLGELLGSDDLDNIPSLEPLVSDVLFLDTVTRMYGPSGTMKSFITLSLAAAVGTGMPWHGRKVRQGNVVYIVAEGVKGMRKRVRAWEQHHGLVMTGVKFLPRPVQVKSPEWAVLIEACRRLEASLVIIDTQARVTVGVNENDNTEMGVIVDLMERMRAATGACVLVVHHSGHADAERGRGASAMKGAMQTELGVTRKGKGLADTRITLATGKQKDDDELADQVLRMRRVELAGEVKEDGSPVSSVVLVPDTEEYTDTAAGNWLVDKLDLEGVPLDWGNRKVREELKRRNISAGSEAIAEAVRVRKSRANWVSGDERKRVGSLRFQEDQERNAVSAGQTFPGNVAETFGTGTPDDVSPFPVPKDGETLAASPEIHRPAGPHL